jgi:hypothetical protein
MADRSLSPSKYAAASSLQLAAASMTGSASPPPDGSSNAAKAEYSRRAQSRESRAASWEARHVQLGYVRLALVAIFLAAAWMVFKMGFIAHTWPRSLAVLLVALPVAAFIAAAVVHARVLSQRARSLRAAEVYRRGLARMEDRWAGTNPRFTDPAAQASSGPGELATDSLYAADLDITGRDGLFELLCTARTRMGEQALLRWLLQPPAAATKPEILAEIRARQQAIAELRGLLDFREAMAIAGDTTRIGVRTEALLAWAEAPDVLRQRWWPWLAGLLALLALAAVGVWFSLGMIVPLVFVVAVEAATRLPLKRQMAAVLDGCDQALENMQLLSALLGTMEAQSFESERLRAITRKLASHQVSERPVAGSAAIARLASLAQFRYAMDNPIVRVLNLPLLYGVQLAFAVQRWRRQHGRAVRLWLESVGEMEALLSLAAYSYEHPADPFPVFFADESSSVAAATGSLEDAGRFEAVDLGHPLLAAQRCVRNSVQIGAATRVLLVSGSNMSGKSTLLRAVGVNAVLAMAGAPVRARSLRLTPLRVAASLLIGDSLQSGQSRFYAEIKRLSHICRLAEQPGGLRVLFLLDELLQGTNSKDRLVGAEGVVGALVQAGAIGIATTHDLALDLALAQMDTVQSGAVRSMHFEDQIVDGQMQFDFRLRDGVVTRSNGVALMRLIGLKV